MRSRSLLAQILTINLLLVAATGTVATIALDARTSYLLRGREAFVLAAGLVATLLGNWLVLRRRFEPLEQIITSMERIDLAAPRQGELAPSRTDSAEVRRLEGAFTRMVSRLESERRQAGRAVVAAQERERQRIAQDLHDEVNQALTAVALRLQASIENAPPQLRRELLETKVLCGQAMEELLALARQLRPAVLDDHGLLAALRSQVQDFAERTGIRASFKVRGTMHPLTAEQQLVIYRVTQESLSNVVQHSAARRADVELSFIGRTLLVVRDDGCGFNGTRNGGLGLSGMRERALLVGGRLIVWSAPGNGTRVELTLA